MSFRKRNVIVSKTPVEKEPEGIRPSPLTGHATTSTGTLSLDNLLGGHNGLILGSCLFVEENGTTDFAGSLLKFYAAQGLVHKHTVHVVGVGEQWTKTLPGLSGGAANPASEPTLAPAAARSAVDPEKMKIAWRYERLGKVDNQDAPAQERQDKVFCHAFDLAKRLIMTPEMAIHHHSINPIEASPFSRTLNDLKRLIAASDSNQIHRVVIPTLLSPAIYSPRSSHPNTFLQFMHSLRALSRRYGSRLTIVMSLPLSLYPRSTGLVRWAEHMCDGVIELTTFPHSMDSSNNAADTGIANPNDEQPQGMVKLLKLPKGRGDGIGDDLAFTLSRRRFVIKPFSLPPIEGDLAAQNGESSGETKMPKKSDLEF